MRAIWWPWAAGCLCVSLPAWGEPAPAPAPASLSSPSPASPSATDAPRSVWYGWNVAAIDFGALALEGGALAIALSDKPHDKTPATVLALTGLSVYLFGPMALHLSRGNPGNAGWSVALRVGAPLVMGGSFALVSAASCQDSPPSDDSDWFQCDCACGNVIWGILGAGVGILSAMVIDAAAIAREPATRHQAFYLAPTFDPHRRSAGLALGGSLF
jgi:hypothetical protein